MTLSIARLSALATALALAGAAAPAWSQYKVVNPDGSVTYTDRPPIAANVRITPMGRLGRNTTPAAAEPALPAELRAPTQRHPVTLFTSSACTPCDTGRLLLQTRGVPYTERRIVTEDDAAALERLVGGRTVPALTIGAQPLRGLSEADWSSYLDAAGYPRENKLPRGWQPPVVTPLVERATPAPAPAPAAAAPRPAAPSPEDGTPVPGTIRF